MLRKADAALRCCEAGSVLVADNVQLQEDYQRADADRVEVIRPRSVGAVHMALAAAQQRGLEAELAALGFNRHQLAAAIGLIIGRMVSPGSELATHRWLGQRSALVELLGYDFTDLDWNRQHRVSDRLLAQRTALEAHLYHQERDLFGPEETMALYGPTPSSRARPAPRPSGGIPARW